MSFDQKDLWPNDKIKKGAGKNAVIITTGAMNPVHRGHAQLLHQAADRLKKEGFAVCGAYLSPTHDGYVKPKCDSLGTTFLTGKFRHAIGKAAVKDDPLVSAAAWEVSWDRFIDYPEVCGRLQAHIGGDVVVFYACGTDHAEKCNLLNGMGTIGVIVVPRSGDKVPSENKDKQVFVAQPCSGDTAEFSSTKVREAIKSKDNAYIEKSVGKEAAQFLLQPTAAQKSEYADDYSRLGV